MAKRQQSPIIRAQSRILRVLEDLPTSQQVKILEFMADQIRAAEAYGAPLLAGQAVVGQKNGKEATDFG